MKYKTNYNSKISRIFGLFIFTNLLLNILYVSASFFEAWVFEGNTLSNGFGVFFILSLIFTTLFVPLLYDVTRD